MDEAAREKLRRQTLEPLSGRNVSPRDYLNSLEADSAGGQEKSTLGMGSMLLEWNKPPYKTVSRRTMVVDAGLQDVVRGLNDHVTEIISFYGAAESVAVWLINALPANAPEVNCVLIARRIDDRKTEMILDPFKHRFPDPLSRGVWNQCCRLFGPWRWISVPELSRALFSASDDGAAECSSDDEIRELISKPLADESEFKASRRQAYAGRFRDGGTMESQINREWQIYVGMVDMHIRGAQAELEKREAVSAQRAEDVAQRYLEAVGVGIATAEGQGGQHNQDGMSDRRKKRAEAFKQIKDKNARLSYVGVAMKARELGFKEATEDDVRNDYRAMGWDWERSDRIR